MLLTRQRNVSGWTAIKMGQIRKDLIIRTVFWLAVAALWALLNKPAGHDLLAIQLGFPTVVGLCFVICGTSLYIWSAQLLAGGAPITQRLPTALLTRGPYRYVRNPLYLSIAAVLAGISAVYGAWSPGHLLLYAGLAIGAHLLVVLVEEPATRKHLGAAYEEYCSIVPRWIPRFRGAAGRISQTEPPPE